ncbi:SRB8 [Candida metapsilosis]|uniref:Mediator of RNA polymerase II transcription subunit 12 n=1 Tax=Candida metapsilosis TaxID=273372 RepID=A0A8H7ZFX1_9ASCO|nr:SRB8 [Candida metapsilosis]
MSSKVKSRNKLLSSHKKSSLTKSSTKDELLALKYSMDRPSLPIYSLQESSTIDVTNSKSNTDGVKETSDLTYPDFVPWKDHTQEKHIPDHRDFDEHTYLSKGYFEAPHVGNEYYSGRNMVSAALFQSNENCLNVVNELSRYLTNAYKSRNENINKIRFNAGHFKIPQKVTLTASKRDSWLNDLSNPNVPLKTIGEKIPHGIRGKVLIESLCSRSTPLNRALWFTKCVLFSELLALRRKYQSKISPESTSPEKFELHWLQDWTQQVAAYMFKVVHAAMSITDITMKDHHMTRMNYLLQFVSSLYVETLLDKPYFLSLLLKPLRDGFPQDSTRAGELIRSLQIDNEDESDVSVEGELAFDIDYGQRFASLVWIKTFWNDIVAIDYLAKELSEGLLLNHFYISKLSQFPKWFLPEHLRENLIKSLSDMVVYLFKRDTNAFVLPENWALTSESLSTIMALEIYNMPPNESKVLADQLELTNYRNESLAINLGRTETIVKLSSSENPKQGIKISNGDVQISMSNRKYKGRVSNTSRLLADLDHLRFNAVLAQQLQPQAGHQSNEDWKRNLKTMLFWSVSPWRYSENQNENILLMCNFLKKSLFVQAERTTKVELENEILDSIFTILESDESLVDSRKLYIMVNELYQLKVITIASYIRKLIASGVFYSSPNETYDVTNIVTQNHLQCLMNLPVLNNKQCDNILRKWTNTGFDFKGAFASMRAQLQSMILDRVFSNKSIDITSQFEDEWSSFKIGLKFLLVNWLTDEFKANLSSSPKLVIFTQDTLANLYRFYAISDNLPVFFKVVVQCILRNDSRMVILYSDGLYLISRLIMRHFKLLKQVFDSSNGATVATLFRSMMQSYRDLSQREFSVYNFQQVWDFIDSVTEKDAPPSRKRKWNDGSEIPYHGAQPERKDSFETPMQIQSVDLRLDHTPRMSDTYSSDDFRNDLDQLRTTKAPPLSASELKELKVISGSTSLDSHLINWFSKMNTMSQPSETTFVKLWKYLTLEVASEKVEELTKSALNDILHSESELRTKVVMIQKLVIYGISSLRDIFSLMDLSNKSHFDVLLHLLFVSNPCDYSDLPPSQRELYKTSLYFFKVKNKQQYTNLVLMCLSESDLQSNAFFSDHKQGLKRFLSQSLLTQGQYIFNEVFLKMSQDDCLSLLNLCLQRSENTHIKSLSDLEDGIQEINEFNLALYQVLLCILSLNLNIKDKLATKKIWEEFLVTFAEKSKLSGPSQCFVFGNLFYLVPWEHKLIMLEIIEDTILSHLFNKGSVILKVNDVDITNAVHGFIDVFLTTAIDTVATPRSFVSRFTELFIKLENIVYEDLPEDCHNSLQSLLSVILKVLVIHKPSLCSFIAENLNDDLVHNFVGKLIRIMESKFMRDQSQKLRVLFRDLLLLLKTSVNDEVTALAENSLPGLDEHHNVDEVRQKESTLVESLSTTAQVQSLFAIPDLDVENPFKHILNDHLVRCAIMLDKEELAHGGDFNHINDCNFRLEIPKSDSLNLPAFVGNILSNEKNEDQEDDHSRVRIRPFRIRSYELLEDTSHSVNDACINLSLFNAYTSEENPP